VVTVPHERTAWLRRGYRLSLFTVLWNVIEGVVAVAAGTLSNSIALIGFGIDSFIETTSAVVVGWRLRAELVGRSGAAAERLERTASRIAGSLLLLLACYLAVDAVLRLSGLGHRAEESLLGIGLTGLSLVVMPVLGRAKLRAARELGSGALRADAFETVACAWLSATTLAGLALNALFGWWWADPLAALVLVPLIAREGLESLRGEACDCGSGDE
jgi:divalent metal cation (Fe/Co/Zn/Cd) transporter